MMKNLLAVIMLSMMQYLTFGQCADASHIYTFSYDGHTYEVVKENKKWEDAKVCAISRGGHLLEINSQQEQDVVFNELRNNADVVNNNTIAPDGGGAPYIWLGGNDKATEGQWIWAENEVQFWLGDKNGNAINGRYNNWGSINNKEPDNYMNKQHALGLCLTDWPNGRIGEWNDINESNELYYVIEREGLTGLNSLSKNHEITVFPNPVSDMINIISEDETDVITEIAIFNVVGRNIRTIREAKPNTQINVSDLIPGIYFLHFRTKSQLTLIKSIKIF